MKIDTPSKDVFQFEDGWILFKKISTFDCSHKVLMVTKRWFWLFSSFSVFRYSDLDSYGVSSFYESDEGVKTMVYVLYLRDVRLNEVWRLETQDYKLFVSAKNLISEKAGFNSVSISK